MGEGYLRVRNWLPRGVCWGGGVTKEGRWGSGCASDKAGTYSKPKTDTKHKQLDRVDEGVCGNTSQPSPCPHLHISPELHVVGAALARLPKGAQHLFPGPGRLVAQGRQVRARGTRIMKDLGGGGGGAGEGPRMRPGMGCAGQEHMAHAL